MATFFGSARGRKRELPADLNLVPFVDLFSTLIIFLIATAVWDQLAAIKTTVGNQAGGDRAVALPQDKKVSSNLKVTIGAESIVLFDAGRTEKIPIINNVIDLETVDRFAAAARQKYADKKDVVIEAVDNARYENLVYVMDQFLFYDFTDLVLAGSAQRL
jgi:biopolymer transport protein ExbD